MSQGETAPEPSMDEILSSIRKIIADDETTATTTATSDESADDADDDDILELTEDDEDPPSDDRDEADEEDPIAELLDKAEADPPRPDAAGDEVEGAQVEPDPAPTEPAPATPGEAAAAMRDMTERLLDGGTATAAAGTLQRLSAAVAPGAAIPGGDRTIEAFLADLVRPELKAWLDRHLPGLVERIVEREIKRLVRDAQPE